MGFRAPTGTEIALHFDDEWPTLTGAEVICRSVPMTDVRLMDEMDIDERNRHFAEKIIIGWNFEDEDGKPLLVTFEALDAMEPWIPQAIRQAWYLGLVEPPAPLSRGSDNGGPSATEASTASPASP